MLMFWLIYGGKLILDKYRPTKYYSSTSFEVNMYVHGVNIYMLLKSQMNNWKVKYCIQHIRNNTYSFPKIVYILLYWENMNILVILSNSEIRTLLIRHLSKWQERCINPLLLLKWIAITTNLQKCLNKVLIRLIPGIISYCLSIKAFMRIFKRVQNIISLQFAIKFSYQIP